MIITRITDEDFINWAQQNEYIGWGHSDTEWEIPILYEAYCIGADEYIIGEPETAETWEDEEIQIHEKFRTWTENEVRSIGKFGKMLQESANENYTAEKLFEKLNKAVWAGYHAGWKEIRKNK